MTSEVLKYLNDMLETAGIPYEFMEFTSSIAALSSYWVGSYSEVAPINEDGQNESQFILTGTTKGSWKELEDQKNVIRNLFPQISGHVATLLSGNSVAIFYSNAFPVETGNEALKRLQINLIVKEWVK